MRVAVAMSGGVDSSVAAWLMVQAGHQVLGLTMNLWPPEAGPAPAVRDATLVARHLGIEHREVDLHREFEAEVLVPFGAGYLAGRTPNPCVVCNPRIKFGHLLAAAQALGAEALATGHYVRREPPTGETSGRYYLRRGVDPGKDQSYALYALDQEQLRRSLFPLGGLTKSEVRRLAAQAGLPVWAREESQDLCFAPGDYRRFLESRYPEAWAPGPVLDGSGRVIGSHPGIAGFTVGQRRGLGVHAPVPLYVLEIRPQERALVVGPAEGLMRRELVARDCRWMAVPGLGTGPPLAAQVKVRYGGPAAAAVLEPVPGQPDGTRVTYHQPQRALTPGQAAVFYRGEVVLGGGTIA